MKICMVISTSFPPEEGIGYYVYNLSRTLVSKGHSVTVITRGSWSTKHEKNEGIDVYRVPFFPIYPFHVYIHGLFVNRLIRSLDLHLIHVHTPLVPVIKIQIPIVSTVHTSVVEDAKFIETVDVKSFFTPLLTKYVSFPIISRTISLSAVVTTVAHSVAREISEHYHYEKTIVVGNAVDEKALVPVPDKAKEKYILFIGRLSYRKGIFDLLSGTKDLLQKYNISLFIVGKGELESKVREYIRTEKMENTVQLLGHLERSELIRVYQNAMVFVLPSHYEGLPTVLLEAMACGIPVVSTNVSGCPDVVMDGENGFLVPSKSPEKIAEAVSRLLESDELRKKFGDNARKTIEKNNTWDNVTNRIEDCYRIAVDHP